MPAPTVIRPPEEFFGLPDAIGNRQPSERFLELEQFLGDHWRRAKQARESQIDDKYHAWQQLYEGIPAEKERVLPWPGSSNFVVQLCRMFIDTYVARSLNIIFATRPLYTLDFIPDDQVRDATQLYLNKKALYHWDHYNLTRKKLQRGAKNGTCVTKTPYIVQEEIDVLSEGTEETITVYDGPQSTPISFDDFYIYPITCEELSKATILFHRIRLVEEEAVRRHTRWRISKDEVISALREPQDVKREQEQEDAGVHDAYLRELHLIECHLAFPISNDPGKYYRVIALLEEYSLKLFDVYYNPYRRNLNIFQDYRPLPREDLFFGESWCSVLAQAQEESSCIHNDRRNASYIANAPVFKMRSDARMPSPGADWFPGKVFKVDSMDDFDMMNVGGSYSDMLAEENHIIMLAERIMGIGAVMQGNAAGLMGKRGIYNATGTLAVLSESNQRQDTNIRDIRQVLGSVGKLSFTLQHHYGPNDPYIDSFDPRVAAQIREGMQISAGSLDQAFFEIKSSDAGSNSEIAKQNLLQIAQVIGQYGAALPQLATQVMSVQNPILQRIFMEVSNMQYWMAKRLMRAYGEFDGAEQLPELEALLTGGNSQQDLPRGPGGTAVPTQEPNVQPLLPGGMGLPGRSEVGAIMESLGPIREMAQGGAPQ